MSSLLWLSLFRKINEEGDGFMKFIDSWTGKESKKVEEWEKAFDKWVEVTGVWSKVATVHFEAKAFISVLLISEREKGIKTLLRKLPTSFWDDADHAVGGYIAKKDLFELLSIIN